MPCWASLAVVTTNASSAMPKTKTISRRYFGSSLSRIADARACAAIVAGPPVAHHELVLGPAELDLLERPERLQARASR